jgi:hypothetical protein
MDTNKVLLTGAGFTHNFGAPLAKDMWCNIFNHQEIQRENRIRELMLTDHDYESVYDSVLSGDFTDSEKRAILLGVINSYNKLDLIITNWRSNPGSPHPVGIYKLQNMINLFSQRNIKGFIFTLNQDLFLERHYYNGDRPIIPGVRISEKYFSSIFRDPLRDQDFIELPSRDELEKLKEDIIKKNSFFYIKMHGSQHWRNRSKQEQIVIGRGKKTKIEDEPLLEWYFELFKRVMFTKDIQMLIIGYGFGDGHINEVLAEAIENYSAGIHIICPKDVAVFHEELLKKDYGEKVWKGLAGYYPYSLLQVFPADGSESQEYADLKDHYFGIK